MKVGGGLSLESLLTPLSPYESLGGDWTIFLFLFYVIWQQHNIFKNDWDRGVFKIGK